MVSSHLPARGGSAGLYDCSDQCMVSSHLPARGGSVTISWKCRSIWTFPVTSPRGEDPHDDAGHAIVCQVSSHLPARGGSWTASRRARPRLFPVTSPRGEDPRNRRGSICSMARFQSPPREGRILPLCHVLDGVIVSSHLPARGGSGRMDYRDTAGWFPVTSPRGEDRVGRWDASGVRRFPVTSPRGEDLDKAGGNPL